MLIIKILMVIAAILIIGVAVVVATLAVRWLSIPPLPTPLEKVLFWALEREEYWGLCFDCKSINHGGLFFLIKGGWGLHIHGLYTPDEGKPYRVRLKSLPRFLLLFFIRRNALRIVAYTVTLFILPNWSTLWTLNG